jgi:hypothetical protein
MRFFCFLGMPHSYMLLSTWGSSSDHFQWKCISRFKNSISLTHSDISQALFFPLHQRLNNKDTQILNFLVIRLLNVSSPGNTVNSTYLLNFLQQDLQPLLLNSFLCCTDPFILTHHTAENLSLFPSPVPQLILSKSTAVPPHAMTAYKSMYSTTNS